ncbi:protein of unknown function [Ralstonia solanacearum CMR15]|nr:protein of unknown function [Ralstonia solanacearum CMR15]
MSLDARLKRLEARQKAKATALYVELDSIEAKMLLIGHLRARERRDPICEALAYRLPFSEWTPSDFVQAIGAEPGQRHPWATCMGFRELWPAFRRNDYRYPPDAQRDARIEADARAWLAHLTESGETQLATRFALMMPTDDELEAIIARLEIEY